MNRVRAGRQQLSADLAVCRRSPGRHTRGTSTAATGIPGGVRERPNRHAWKACVGRLTVGSNPTPSASQYPARLRSPQGQRARHRHHRLGRQLVRQPETVRVDQGRGPILCRLAGSCASVTGDEHVDGSAVQDTRSCRIRPVGSPRGRHTRRLRRMRLPRILRRCRRSPGPTGRPRPPHTTQTRRRW